jgi:hypothetical protein
MRHNGLYTALREALFLMPAFLCAGCPSCQSYHEQYQRGVESLTWPSGENPFFAVEIGNRGEVLVHDREAKDQFTFQIANMDRSVVVKERIRFSRDGALLFIPLKITSFTSFPDRFDLRIYDLKKRAFLKTLESFEVEAR